MNISCEQHDSIPFTENCVYTAIHAKCLVIVWKCNDKPNWLSLGSEGSDDSFILCIFRYRTFLEMITMINCLKAI